MPQYDDETAVSSNGEAEPTGQPNASKQQRWTGHVHEQWCIGDNPNGGYLVSIAMGALTRSVPHPDPLSTTTHFLRPGISGAPCEVVTEIVRIGRSMSTGRATLLQDGKPRIELLAAFGDLASAVGIDASLTLDSPVVAPVDVCTPRSGKTQGVELPILQRLDTLIDPARAQPKGSDRAMVAGHIRFADGRAPDSRSLLLFCDAFPPSPFPLLGNIGWVPTIELTVHVRARPAPGWITGQLETHDLRDGRMIESGALWDSTGQLVAQCRQIGLVMPN